MDNSSVQAIQTKMVMLFTPIKPIPEGNVTIKATDHAEHPNSSTSDPIEATDTTPPSVPKVNTGLNGKANTYTPVSVSTDPNTKSGIVRQRFPCYWLWRY